MRASRRRAGGHREALGGGFHFRIPTSLVFHHLTAPGRESPSLAVSRLLPAKSGLRFALNLIFRSLELLVNNGGGRGGGQLHRHRAGSRSRASDHRRLEIDSGRQERACVSHKRSTLMHI